MSERLGAVCVRALAHAAGEDQSIWLLDGDLADSYGATAFEDQFPDRFVMGGIAEQNLVSMAAGLAACDQRPWVFSFAAFLIGRAYDQVRVSLSQANTHVVLVGSHAGGCGGRNGKTHLALNDLAMVCSLPNFEVWSPADPSDVIYATQRLCSEQNGGPVYMRLPRQPCGTLPGEAGEFRAFGDGAGILIVGYGLSAHWALEVREILNANCVAATVISVAKLSPLPRELSEKLQLAEKLYIIEDHVKHGGLHTILTNCQSIKINGWFGWPCNWAGESGTEGELRAACGLDAQSIAAAILVELQ
ncbi:transketolase family protein [Rhizobium laguerreae]|uniref:transketolase family protein n=1 Tax=Rhizobium laguerreae TaxID=1076926 RepID=UPI001C9085F1|nr:transketolase C-terminal domain-containing protein [Rhizobium laguerreae]MBY3158019.1 transketolase [Rhizobium laguerreae]MBY3447036.1 transketolase [Rhizobium laguerreae]